MEGLGGMRFTIRFSFISRFDTIYLKKEEDSSTKIKNLLGTRSLIS